MPAASSAARDALSATSRAMVSEGGVPAVSDGRGLIEASMQPGDDPGASSPLQPRTTAERARGLEIGVLARYMRVP